MNQNSTSKNFSYVSMGRVIETILLAVFYIILASILEPEKYGELNVIIALAGTFAVISRFGLNFSVQVYQAKGEKEVANKINTLFLVLTSVATIVLLTIDVYAALLCFGISFFAMNFHSLLGLKQYKKFMLNTILRGALIVSIPVLLYFVLDIPGIILGMALSNLIASIPYFKHLKLNSFLDLKKHYKVLIHNFGFESAGTLPIMIDKLIISFLYGLFVVGIYQLNLQVFLALSVLPGSLGAYLISEESSGNTHRRLSLLVVLGSVGLSAAGIIFAPFLISEFFPKYAEGIFSLQILLIGLVSQTIGTIYVAKLMAKESTKIGIVAIIKIITIIVLIIWLGGIYGLVGLSLSVVISSIFSTIFFYYLYRVSK